MHAIVFAMALSVSVSESPTLIDNTTALLAIPQLRAEQKSQRDMISTAFALKMGKYRAGITHLRSDKRISESDIASREANLKLTKERDVSGETQEKQARHLQRIHRAEQRIEQMKWLRELDTTVTDREAKAVKLEAENETMKTQVMSDVQAIKEQQEQDLEAMAAQLAATWVDYKSQVKVYFKDVATSYPGAVVQGHGDNATYLTYSQQAVADDYSYLHVTLTLAGFRDMPGNAQAYRDGMITWFSDHGDKSTLVAYLDVFEINMTVKAKKTDEQFNENQMLASCPTPVERLVS